MQCRGITSFCNEGIQGTHEEYLPQPGTKIHARHFVPGQCIDVLAISKGKEFQSATKNEISKGCLPRMECSSRNGPLGRRDSARIQEGLSRGRKWRGGCGVERVIMQNLRIVKIDRGRNLVLIEEGIWCMSRYPFQGKRESLWRLKMPSRKGRR